MNKETHLNLNLISKSRKDQMKLIGRVKMDLADLMSNDSYVKLKSYKLSYCSVDAELVLSAALTAKELTNMHPNHLDISSFRYSSSHLATISASTPLTIRMSTQNQITTLKASKIASKWPGITTPQKYQWTIS